MFPDYTAVTLNAAGERLVYNGNMFSPECVQECTLERIPTEDGRCVRVYGNDGQFIAIYQYCKSRNIFKLVKMFFDKKDES